MFPGLSWSKYLLSSASISATSAAAASLVRSSSGSGGRPRGMTRRWNQLRLSARPRSRDLDKRPIAAPEVDTFGVPVGAAVHAAPAGPAYRYEARVRYSRYPFSATITAVTATAAALV